MASSESTPRPASRRRSRRSRRDLSEIVGDSVVAITGASTGIGAATAKQLGAAGATVALIARREAELDNVAAEVRNLGGQASVHVCDLSDLDAVAVLAKDVLEVHGQVDILINNAGKSIRRPIRHSYDRIGDFERMIQLNYLGAVQLILGVLPQMRTRRRGHIINISSYAVQGKIPRFAGYVASKAALDAFSECAAAEVRHDRVRFTTVHMPLVRTDMITPTRLYNYMPAKSPERAADMVCDAIIRRPHEVNALEGSLMAMGNRLSPRGLSLAARNAIYRAVRDSPSPGQRP